MSLIDGALNAIGVDLGGANTLGSSISQFNAQNLSPQDVLNGAKLIDDLVTRAPALAALAVPSPNVDLSLIPQVLRGGVGTGGVWEAIHYADDWNAHHPKFKFLFKVNFEGFPGGDFYKYVYRSDKPRVRLNHTDVNYYNFRTRVLTSVTFDPLSMTFVDEIGNATNDFFVNYLKKVSGTGSGNTGIEKGFGSSSSTKSYKKGYSEGKKIVVQQIFANGTLSNKFKFINPRIESFDFDELSMEENAGSMMTLTFTYDALECETTGPGTINSWGNTDLLRGGGSSGPSNGGDDIDTTMNPPVQVSSGSGSIGNNNARSRSSGSVLTALQDGVDLINSVPESLRDLVSQNSLGIAPAFFQDNIVTSASDVVSRGINDTLDAINSGSNMIFGGFGSPNIPPDVPPFDDF